MGFWDVKSGGGCYDIGVICCSFFFPCVVALANEGSFRGLLTLLGRGTGSLGLGYRQCCSLRKLVVVI